MKAEEIIERFAASGIECREEHLGDNLPIYDMDSYNASYVIGDEGANVLWVKGTVRVFVPYIDDLEQVHVDKLIEATKDENVLGAVLTVRSDGVMGMCLFV